MNPIRLLRCIAVMAAALAFSGAAPLRGQDIEDWAQRPKYSSFGFALGYNTFSPAGDTRYVHYASDFKSTGGLAVNARLLWSPNILGHIFSIGGEYQSLAIVNYDSSTLYYVESGKAVTATDYADLWQFLLGIMLVNNESVLIQAQLGYGSWTSEYDFTEKVASARLVAAFPLLGRFITFDPELAYYKGVGAYKNSAFSIQLGLAIRL
jgi:hypothetical protein